MGRFAGGADAAPVTAAARSAWKTRGARSAERTMAERHLAIVEGQRVRNAFNGETFIFTHALEDPDVAQFDVYLEPGGILAGTGMHHVHPCADEEFLVKNGRLALSIDGARRALEPGKSFVARRGVPHYFRNGHEGETLFTCRFTPGQQFLRFFLNMSLGTALHPERYDSRGEPTPSASRAGAPRLYGSRLFGRVSDLVPKSAVRRADPLRAP